MDKKVLTLTVVVTAVSVGTYVILNAVKPHQHNVEKVADIYSADAIFQGKEDPNGPDETPINAGPASETAAAAPAPAETAPAPEAAAADTSTASADGMSTPVEAGATAPAPDTTAAPAPAADSAAPAPAAPSEPAMAAAAPAPVAPEPAAAPAAEPAPAPAAAPVETAAAEPAPAPKPKKKRVKKPTSHSSSTASAAAPASTAINAWWPAANPAQLSMVYAGPASFKRAVVLMFNSDFASADSANATIKVIDTKGNPVTPAWELGATNKRMLILPVTEGGFYKITVGAELTDGNQRKLGSELSGDVIVR